METLVEQTQKRLQEHGGRMTAQRRLILEALDSLESHPTAEELYEIVRLEDPSLHLSTIYRTLRWLEQEGMVSARVFDEKSRCERFDPAPVREHYHFLCSNCQKVIEFDNLLVQTIKAQFELHSGALVETGSVVLYGLCADCACRP